jgi:hypothetical protein
MFTQIAKIPLRTLLTTGLAGAAVPAAPFAAALGASVLLAGGILMLDKNIRAGTIRRTKGAANWVGEKASAAATAARNTVSFAKA